MDRKTVLMFLVIVLFITKCSKRNKVETGDKITSPLASYVKNQDKNFDRSLLQGVWWLNFDDNSALFLSLVIVCIMWKIKASLFTFS